MLKLSMLYFFFPHVRREVTEILRIESANLDLKSNQADQTLQPGLSNSVCVFFSQ